jgi:SAM-dependent methyltransferase
MAEEASEISNRSPEQFADDFLIQLPPIYRQRETENQLIMATFRKELADLPADSSDDFKGTVMPVTAENPAYQEEDSISKTDFLRERLQGKVLDIGANGRFELKNFVPDNMVTYVDKEARQGQLQADARRLPFNDGSFNSIYSRNCFQIDPEQLIPEALRVLKPEGNLVIASSFDSFEDVKEGLLSILAALQKNGVDISTACNLTLNKVVLRHKTFPIESTRPEVLLTINRSSRFDQKIYSP